MRTGTRGTTASALVLLTALATACTTDTSPDPGRPTTPPAASAQQRDGQQPTRAATELAQGARARAALETTAPEEDPAFVASGLERVRDGVHHRSPLTRGASYTVSVACAGTGTVTVVIDRTAFPPAPCDSVPVRHRVDRAPGQLPLSVTGTPGSTGMIAWRITATTT
ncbi:MULTISPECIES: hypothetical protein [unclassified Streptomyces]|jgi:hypothetical protein|uniref:hypothetical protein n=1 Tax=unclassified Streptomyces TaxID=2593676 RepID=UPI0036C4AB8A